MQESTAIIVAACVPTISQFVIEWLARRRAKRLEHKINSILDARVSAAKSEGAQAERDNQARAKEN
ncbi:MAG TPA: hypothetical protein VJX23_02905 [Candidatus Binataceae bacterium]|nr:hypothetical protein [Candidatus Binataceae bacterium]